MDYTQDLWVRKSVKTATVMENTINCKGCKTSMKIKHSRALFKSWSVLISLKFTVKRT